MVVPKVFSHICTGAHVRRVQGDQGGVRALTEMKAVVPGNAVSVEQMNACTKAFPESRANRVARNAVTSMGVVNAARDQRAAREYRETFGVSLPCAKSVTHQD